MSKFSLNCRGFIVSGAMTAILCACGTQSVSFDEPAQNGESSASSVAVASARGSSDFGQMVAESRRLDAGAVSAAGRGIFIDAAPAQFPIEAMTDGDVVVAGTLESIAAGAIDTEPGVGVYSRSLVLAVRVQEVRAGEVVPGDVVHARLVVPRNLKSLRSALRLGSPVVMLATPEDSSFDEYLDAPRRGFPDGAPRLQTGGNALAVADGPERSWFPGLYETFQRPASEAFSRP